MSKQSKVIEERQIYRGKWLGMKHVDFSIGSHTVRNYEAVFRTTSKPGKIDGVDIIPIIRYRQRKPEILMNIEFRPPVKGFTLEFPTGMTEDEDYEENAKRQLLEETGCIVSCFEKIPFPATYYDPWKSNQTGKLYIANIDGDSRDSFRQQKLQQAQCIKNVRFEIDETLLDRVAKYAKQHNLHVQSSVFTICLGIWLKHNLQTI